MRTRTAVQFPRDIKARQALRLAWCSTPVLSHASTRREGKAPDTPIAHQMDVWQGDQCRQLLQEFQRREAHPRGAIRPRMSEGGDTIAVGVLPQQLQRHGPASGVADEAFQYS